MVDVAALIACGVAPTQARAFAGPLAIACARFNINTPARLAGFVAQCRVESVNFTQLEESLWYTTAERIRAIWPSRVTSLADAARFVRNPQELANRVYSSRLGNRDEASGDGWRYIGRGLKQLTGLDNYKHAATTLRRPYVESPELVAQPADACLTAAWYWHSVGGNMLADGSQWDAITRAVNGPAMLQAGLRRQYSEQGVQAFA